MISESRPPEAVAVLRPALAVYPGDARLGELLRTAEESDRRLAFENEIALVSAQARALIAQQQYEEAISLVNGRYAGVDRLQPLVARAQHELVLKRQREAREQAKAQLLALDEQIPSTRKFKLAGVITESRRIAALHSEDGEIGELAARIERQVNAILTAPVPPRPPLPSKWIGGGAAVLAVAAAGIIVVPRLRTPPPAKQPQPSTYSVEIRTDPAGAAVAVGNQQCTSPNCRLSLKPGDYLVSARLPGYKPAEQPLHVAVGSAPTSMTVTLAPEPPPPPPSTSASGALLIRAAFRESAYGW